MGHQTVVLFVDRSCCVGGPAAAERGIAIDAAAFLDRFEHLDVLDGHGLHLEGIGAQHHQVGQLAGLQGPLGFFLVVLVGAVDCHGAQSVVWAHPFLGRQHHVRFGGAVDDVPEGIDQAGADARRHVVVDGPRDTGPLHRAGSAGPGQSLGAHQLGQIIAHGINTGGGEAGDGAHLFGPLDLVWS